MIKKLWVLGCKNVLSPKKETKDRSIGIVSIPWTVGVEMLRTGGSALDAACAATMVLEDAGETNAGYGSNLTESGTVEMGELNQT